MAKLTIDSLCLLCYPSLVAKQEQDVDSNRSPSRLGTQKGNEMSKTFTLPCGCKGSSESNINGRTMAMVMNRCNGSFCLQFTEWELRFHKQFGLRTKVSNRYALVKNA